MAALKKKSERAPFDTYETPEWAVKCLFDLVPIRRGWTYMEPCRASGRFYNELPIGSAWGEIREGVDYLNTPYDRVANLLPCVYAASNKYLLLQVVPALPI